MNSLKPFSARQAAYIRRCTTAWLNVAEGGKRSGKNVIQAVAFCAHLETHPDKLHVVAGVSESAARLNVIDCNGYGVKNYFDGRCRAGKYENRECLYVRTKTGEKVILIFGGGKEGSQSAVKGNTYGMAMVTEANECSMSFVQELLDRTLSSGNRKIFHDLNPKAPAHWYYTDFLNFHELKQSENPGYGYNYGHFTIADNYAFSDAQIKELLNTYDKTSMWYAADIRGQRVTAIGRIYPSWGAANVITPEKLRDFSFTNFSIGIDIGGTDATVATLVGFTRDYRQAVLIDGYYHKQGRETGKTHRIYALDILDKVKTWVAVYPVVARCGVFVESADKLFRTEFKHQLDSAGLNLMQVIPSYKKDGIEDRIRLQSILIYENRLLVRSELAPWITAYTSAVWNEKDKEKGNWVRVDDGSYPVDCLDSAEYAIQPYKTKLLNVR
ncbi:MAG: terminase family protein [Clostridiales bacterium]|nr:terminase family protein [Clostridiales bacterium]